MKQWIKRVAGGLLVLAGAALFARHALRLLDWPHLYPDLGELGKENLIFLGLTLLALALAWISGAYLLLHREDRVLHLLIPAAAFVLLMSAGGLCLTRAVGEIPCSYTTSLEVCREEFDPEAFRVQGKALYPALPKGELTDYACYQKGEVLSETVTRSYDQEDFNIESARLAALGLTAFQPDQDPRERPITCYAFQMGDTLWQVLLVPKTKSVTYSRFNCVERLPSFAPQPTEPGQNQPQN